MSSIPGPASAAPYRFREKEMRAAKVFEVRHVAMGQLSISYRGLDGHTYSTLMHETFPAPTIGDYVLWHSGTAPDAWCDGALFEADATRL